MPIDWSRLRGLTARDLIRALEQDGFLLKGQKGSHRRYQHQDGRRVTAAFHSPGMTFIPKTLQSMIED